MENFFYQRLKRASFAALLEENKIEEALLEYEKYRKNIKNLLKSFKYLNKRKIIKQELEASSKFLCNKLLPIANKLFGEKSYNLALKCYDIIFKTDPFNQENLRKYINTLEKVEQNDLCLELASKLINIEESAENYKILSSAYASNKKYHKAIELYEKYVEYDGRLMDGVDYNLIGCHYYNCYTKSSSNIEDMKKSLEYFQEALKFEPDSKIYIKNTMLSASKLKDYDTERALWRKCFKLGYCDEDDKFAYSAFCLRNGDIKTWGKYYNARFTKQKPAVYPKISKPVWNGEDISDKILLIHSEQGFGDNFLMWGYAPRVVKLAKKVIWVARENTDTLLNQNNFGIEVIPNNKADLDKIEFDVSLPCMSLPIVLNLDKSNISVGGGYIKAPLNRVEKYKQEYFNTDKFKVGFGFMGISSNSKRDIPFDKLLMLDKLKDVELYCFTKGIADKKFDAFKNNKVNNIAKYFKDFADTAAAIENVDIVVSSDNCILNLAGAMGKKTIGVYNYDYEFRWFDLTGEDCGWYTSVKPIVNNKDNDWGLTMKLAIDEVNKYRQMK